MNLPLVILQCADAWLALDKPAGLASIPEGAGDPACAQALAQAQVGGRLWAVHRLDKEASGVLLFARSAAAHRHLSLAFQERQVVKRYLALAWGRMEAEAATVREPLREFGSGRVAVDRERGKPSETAYRVLARGPGGTLVEVMPRTGRRHQIRAHFHHLGHPLAGDARYGHPASRAAAPRLMLHACALEFTDDRGVACQLACPPGPDFRAALEVELGAPGQGWNLP